MATSKQRAHSPVSSPASRAVARDTTTTIEATPAPSSAATAPSTDESEPSPEQFNAHDAKRLAKQIDAMLLTLTEMGYQVEQGQIKAAADAQAACEILVAHGIVSEAEVQARAYRAAASIIAGALQQAEELRLRQQQQARSVQAVRQPGIVVARH